MNDRHSADLDARLYGTGFLVDDRRVAPDRVQVLTPCMPSVAYREPYMLVFRDVILDDTLWRKLRIRLGRPKRADIEVRKEMTSMEAVDAVMLGLEMVEQVPELYLEVDVRGSLEESWLDVRASENEAIRAEGRCGDCGGDLYKPGAPAICAMGHLCRFCDETLNNCTCEHVQVTAVEEEAYEGPSLACMRPIRSVQGER